MGGCVVDDYPKQFLILEANGWGRRTKDEVYLTHMDVGSLRSPQLSVLSKGNFRMASIQGNEAADQKLQEILARLKGGAKGPDSAKVFAEKPLAEKPSQEIKPSLDSASGASESRTRTPQRNTPPVTTEGESSSSSSTSLGAIGLGTSENAPGKPGILSPQSAKEAQRSPVNASSVQSAAPIFPSAVNAKSDKPLDKLNQNRRFILTSNEDEPFIPREPECLADTGLQESLLEEIILRFLYANADATGRGIADQVKLPFRILEPILSRLKYEQLTTYRGATSTNDYIHLITDAGRERARAYIQKTTYYGAAPVTLKDYAESVKQQSIEKQQPTEESLRKAFSDLLVPDNLIEKLGPAVNSGRGMFLFGFPGNGKTSIAERVTAAFGKYIWVPRALVIDGEIIRIFDPMLHNPETPQHTRGWLNNSEIDHRWIRIQRPTVVAGGELTMSMLEIIRSSESRTSEAPLQMKSNCGVLLIDDFGRQRMSVDELLNRWIVPLEKRYDFLNLPSGKKTQVPFDQLVVFSTNLEPKDLVDEAFLRRIPYKIEVTDPNEATFRKLFEIMSKKLSIRYEPSAIDYLIEKHYRQKRRPFRNCHPRDLLMQVRNYCLFKNLPVEMKSEYLDYATENYFSVM